MSTNFSKKSNIKFHKNPTTVSNTVPSGQIDRETQKQQKLISVTFCKTAIKSNENSKIDNGKFIAIMCLFKSTLTDQ